MVFISLRACSVTQSCPTLLRPHVVRQDLLSMGIPRQEYWGGLPFPSLRDFPDPGIELMPPALAGRFFTTEPIGVPLIFLNGQKKIKRRMISPDT